ncbi:thioredoxin-like domain-containing protein [Leeuwenhoekiella sp. H156]|uniref:TlpA family protein disulfide reductase n=1 Tax=Leeuwenhoekiella sp. H156 TaxID=3450128 RepID=UPI003FA4A5E8
MRLFIWIAVVLPFLVHAQTTTKIQLHIDNANVDKVYFLKNDYAKPSVLFGERLVYIPLEDGELTWQDQISKPLFINAGYRDSSTNESFTYSFYVSPGDSLEVSFDAENPDSTIVVQGKGYRNNQPLLQKVLSNRESYETYQKDSLPYNVLEAIKLTNAGNKKLVKEYNEKYNPDQSLVEVTDLYVEYFPLWTYLTFSGAQKFYAGEAFKRNESKWHAITDSLTRKLPMNNAALFDIPNYVYFLPLHLIRLKEYVWSHNDLLPYYYDTATQEEALKLYNNDRENVLREKIINKHFEGRTAEFLYATLFKSAIDDKEDSLTEIYSRFVKKYPNSAYIPYIEPAIKEIEAKRARKLTDKMQIIENADAYTTFDEVLELAKGKTVLLDMWGTWCGPCRKEFSLNSEAIKKHFKDRDLEYLYIANLDIENEKKWKKLIAYYKLEGTHILASAELTENIMEILDRTSYPTYAILKKDGTFELSKAGYPMNREVLFDQIEKALK